MDENSLMREKLDEELYKKLGEGFFDGVSEDLNVIIQTNDGLKDDDRQLIKTLKGRVKDNLYIINAFSAALSTQALKKLILSPRVKKVYYDAKVNAR